MRVLMIWWTISICCAGASITGQEQESPPYCLLDVENGLQQKLVGEDVDRYLMFDASEFLTQSNEVNENSVTLQAIRSCAKQLDESDVLSRTIVATVYISAESRFNKLEAIQSFFKKELAGGKIKWTLRFLVMNSKQTFQQYLDQHMGEERDDAMPNAATLESDFVETERFIVYPVYTRLSRLLTGNASCHVEVLPDLNSLSEAPGCEALAGEIKTAVKTLELMDYSKVVFVFHGKLDPKQLEAAGSPLKTIGFQEGFVQDLGFKHSSVVIR